MAERRIIWSADAKRDLFNILDFFVQRNGNTAYSLQVNKEFRKVISLLKKNHYLGRPTQIEDVRVVTKGDYQIVYEIKNSAVHIHMIWDCRRNPDEFDYEKRII